MRSKLDAEIVIVASKLIVLLRSNIASGCGVICIKDIPNANMYRKLELGCCIISDLSEYNVRPRNGRWWKGGRKKRRGKGKKRKNRKDRG